MRLVDPKWLIRRNFIFGQTLSVGLSEGGRVLVVSYVERVDETIRIISAREASRRERNSYEAG